MVEGNGIEACVEFFVGDEVGFVDDQNELLRLGHVVFYRSDCIVNFLIVVAGIDEEENNCGKVYFGKGALNANGFDFVGGFANAGGVDKAESDAFDVKGVFDDIAGGAMDVADDGSFFVEKGI